MTDFFDSVPTTFAANLEYRLKLRERAAKDAGFRRAMLQACKQDVLFFFSAWCWVYEPRIRFGKDGKRLPKTMPFIPWEHQIPVIREVDANLGLRDIGVIKSRVQGMSWIALLFAVRDWIFEQGSKVGLVSNTEANADTPGNMDSLLAKVDWEIFHLPKWMVGERDVDWKRNLNEHSLVNLRNFSQINAFAATGNAGRGGRYKWFLADELAFWDFGAGARLMESIRSSTECRLVISTPNGSSGVYYNFMHAPSSNLVRLKLRWQDNPTLNRGMYEIKGGVPVAVDPIHNPLPPHYNPPTKSVLDMFSGIRRKGFKLEGRVRSPWYDNECDKGDATPHSIAQELDCDFGGSEHKYFGAEFIDKAVSGARLPLVKGNFSYHPETLAPEFDTSDTGQLLLWCPLDVKNRPPKHPYVIGADIGTGLGGSHTSNSVVSVIDLQTMEQVAEFAINTMQTHDFADFCMALGKWFHDAYLIWEHNGTGAGFTRRVLAQAYPNIYRRKNQYKGSAKRTTDAGWVTTSETKESMFGDLYRAIKGGELTIRSDDLVKECLQYVRINGKIEHALAVTTEDESSKGTAHGDRVIAFAVCYQGARDRPLSKPAKSEELSDDPPYGTLAWRERFHRDAKRKQDTVWDDRTNDDLAGGESVWSIDSYAKW